MRCSVALYPGNRGSRPVPSGTRPGAAGSKPAVLVAGEDYASLRLRTDPPGRNRIRVVGLRVQYAAVDLVDDADPDSNNELNTSLILSDSELRIGDAGGVLSVDLGGLVNDADPDPTNELNRALLLSGVTLEITDAGGTLSADLVSLVDDGDWLRTGEDLYRELGRIGIGTNAPAEALHVAGNAIVTGTVTAATFEGDGSMLSGIVLPELELASAAASLEKMLSVARPDISVRPECMRLRACTTDGTTPFRLTTPLPGVGEDVTGLLGLEELSRLFVFYVAFEHAGSISAGSILGQAVTLELGGSDGTREGVATAFGLAAFDPATSRGTYVVKIEPQAAVLSYTKNYRIFQGETRPAVIQQLLIDHGVGVSAPLSGTYEPREYLVQYDETDLDFVHRLAESSGIFYFFPHAAGTDSLTLADEPAAYPNTVGGTYHGHLADLPGARYVQEGNNNVSSIAVGSANVFIGP